MSRDSSGRHIAAIWILPRSERDENVENDENVEELCMKGSEREGERERERERYDLFKKGSTKLVTVLRNCFLRYK
jgi:hypothetical protein